MNGINQKRSKVSPWVLLLTAGLVCSTVHAADVIIEQKDVQFWFGGKALKAGDEVRAKVGDNLRIVNVDKLTHNAFSLHEKFFFDGGAQKPKAEGGQDINVKIESAGLFDIGCAIHPNMVFKLKVE